MSIDQPQMTEPVTPTHPSVAGLQFVQQMAVASKAAIIDLGRVGGIPFILIWMGFVLLLLSIVLIVFFTTTSELIENLAVASLLVIVVFSIVGLVDRYIKMALAQRTLRDRLARYDRLTELMVESYFAGRSNIEIAQFTALGDAITRFQQQMVQGDLTAGQ